MPPQLDPRLEAGTPIPLVAEASDYPAEMRAAFERIGVLAEDRSPKDYVSYSLEQIFALHEMKDHSYEHGIAKAEFVNHVLWPDGTIDTDTTKLVETVRALRNAIEDGNAPGWAGTDATAHSRLMQDIAEHVAAKRFLFIVSTYDNPRWWLVYFQCATESNPELPALVAAEG